MNVVSNNSIKCTVALAVLQDVTDPEIGLNVVDLGLIYQIDFDEESNQIFVCMTLTTQFCPMSNSIVDAVTNSLENAFTGSKVTTTLTFEPQWNTEMISGEGQEFLNK